MHKLAERLKKLRELNNVSQNALSKELKVTRATVNAWEMGINIPNAQSLVLLSEYFCVSVDYLLGFDDRDILDISELDTKEQEMISEMVRYLISIKKKK